MEVLLFQYLKRVKREVENRIDLKVDKSDRLKHILEHAYKNTRFYSKYSGCSFHDIPILTKDIIRANRKELISSDLGKRDWFYNTSGGSTGEPVRLIQDSTYNFENLVNKYLFKRRIGFQIGEPMLKIWGSERDIGRNNRIRKYYHYLRSGVFHVNSFWLSNDQFDWVNRFVSDKNPKLIVAYVQSLFELTNHYKQKATEINPFPPIISTAGVLSEELKNSIEGTLKTTCYNRYGSREVGDMACGVPGKAHMEISPNVWLEVLDDSGNQCGYDRVGDIVVTSLTNYAMPLIRYKIGDRGSITKRGFEVQLRSVEGRQVSTFVSSEGKMIDGEYFSHLLYFKDWVKKFQVVQLDFNLVTIKVVLLEKPPQVDLEEIREGCKRVLGEKCDVRFEYYEELESSSSGKHIYTISHISQNN